MSTRSMATESAAPPVPAETVVQEVDVWWGGFAVRALVPQFLLSLAFSVFIVVLAYYLWGEHGVRPHLARWVAYYLNGALWLYHLLRWAYRIGSYNYRLTTRRLYCWWGILSLPPPPVDLTDIEAVQVVQSPLEHWLQVGRLVVRAVGRVEPLVLVGVMQPQRLAGLVQSHVTKARALAGSSVPS